jgi:tetratricopeptide (TPR) repeat protein
MAKTHLDLALVLKRLNQVDEANQHLQKAIEEFQEKLERNPNSHEDNLKLGVALAELGQFSEATKYIQKAMSINPSDTQGNLALANVLLAQDRQEEAIGVLKKAIDYSSSTGDKAALLELQNALRLIENENSDKN